MPMCVSLLFVIISRVAYHSHLHEYHETFFFLSLSRIMVLLTYNLTTVLPGLKVTIEH